LQNLFPPKASLVNSQQKKTTTEKEKQKKRRGENTKGKDEGAAKLYGKKKTDDYLFLRMPKHRKL